VHGRESDEIARGSSFRSRRAGRLAGPRQVQRMRDESIYDLLKNDHQAVKALFAQMESSEDSPTRTRLVARLKQELLAHSEAEDLTFYTPLKASELAHDIVLEAEEEHRVVSRLLGELERLSPENERWKARVAVLKELVEHHVGEEEGEMFKKARKVFDRAQELEIGANFLAEKKRIQASLRAA
jgi:hemerythrin superfamily protein